MSKKILVGSNYFFKDLKDFSSKDIDYLVLEHNPKGYQNQYQLTGKNECLFKWRKMPVAEFIDITLKTKCPMEAGKFLVKEVAYMIGMKIEDLKQLRPVFERMDSKHKYEKIIFESYIQNNGFFLTEVQRLKAFESYKAARK